MNLLKIIFTKLFLFTIIIFFSSCSSEDKTTKVREDNSLSIAFSSWPGFDIIYYAQINNIFKKYNLNIELKKYPTQEDATKALENEEVDAAMTSIFDALNLKSEQNFNIILTTNVSFGADGIVSHKNIKSIKDLKGKKVSAQKGTVNELILIEALEFNNLKIEDITLVDVTNNEALPMLFHKEIDAAVIWEPLLRTTKTKIKGNILFTTKEINSSVIDILIVQEKSFKKNKNQWKRFLFTWYTLMDELKNNKKNIMKELEDKMRNPDFTQDYNGLKPGTITLNKEMFFNNRLEDSINKINTFISVENQATLILEKEFVKESIEEWNKIH